MFPEYRTIAFEYPDETTAGDVFARANEQLRDCSVWRTATPDLSRWFIMAILGENCQSEDFDWKGEPIEVTEDQRLWMISRRLARGVTAIIRGEGAVDETRHFSQGNAPHAPGH